MVRRIMIDEDVYTELGRHARPFEQPNDVLRRLLFDDDPAAPSREDADGALLSLIEAGLLRAGDDLIHRRIRKGKTYSARVERNGMIVTADGSVHSSPSRALSTQIGTSVNGWKSWVHVPSQRTLDELRAELTKH